MDGNLNTFPSLSVCVASCVRTYVCVCVCAILQLYVSLSLYHCSGVHLAVIHSRPDILTQLLALVSTDDRLRVALDEQNSLYQVCIHVFPHTMTAECALCGIVLCQVVYLYSNE